MRDDESFDEFNARLSDIANSCYGLGEPITESKICHKILRSLPDRFAPKVTAIEESKNVDTMKKEELVGSLQTYEVTLRPNRKESKSRGVALKTIREEHFNDISDSDSDSLDETMVLFVKKFKKFFRKKKEGQSSPASMRNKENFKRQATKHGERPSWRDREKKGQTV